MTTVTPAAEPVIIRPARPDEVGIVRTQWLRSYEHSPFARCMTAQVYRKAWGDVLAALLSRSTVLMLCPEDVPDAVIYGWVAWEPEYSAKDAAGPVLHYLHVRAASRRLGYARRLLAELPMAFHASHATGEFQRLLEKWEQDDAVLNGKCFRADCHHTLTQERFGNEVTYRCDRRPAAGRPPCLVQFSRPVGFKSVAHPVVTVDLTRV